MLHDDQLNTKLRVSWIWKAGLIGLFLTTWCFTATAQDATQAKVQLKSNDEISVKKSVLVAPESKDLDEGTLQAFYKRFSSRFSPQAMSRPEPGDSTPFTVHGPVQDVQGTPENIASNTVELILDDGSRRPDVFLGQTFLAGLSSVWGNIFELNDEGFLLEEVHFYMRTEFAATNPVRVAIANNSDFLIDSVISLDVEPDGAWFTVTLRSPLEFEAGDNIFIIVENGNTSIVQPAGFDFDAEVRGQSFYFDYLTDRLESVTNLDGFEDGAFLIRAVGSYIEVNQPPIPTGSISAGMVQVGETVTFDASNSEDPDGFIDEYLWEFGDGESSRREVATHEYDRPGEYIVTLTVTDNSGASQSAVGSVIVEVNQPPIAAGTISSGQANVGETVTFDASGSEDPDGEIVEYLWEFGDGESSRREVATHVYERQGEYNVTLTVTDNLGATHSVFGAVQVKDVNRPPTADASISSTEVHVGETIRFDASDSVDPDGEIAEYLWEFGDGESSTQATAIHAYERAGQYTVILTVTDALNAASSVRASITVTSPTRVANEAEESGVPGAWSLKPNYPNPFNPATTIPFELSETTSVRLTIYDMLGRTIDVLEDGVYPAGAHQVVWKADSMPSGTYIYRLEANGETQTRMMNLLK